MRFMTLTLERIYMSGFLSISFEHEIDIIPIQSIYAAMKIYFKMLFQAIAFYEKSLTGVITTFS